MAEEYLAAVVAKPAAEATMARFRERGVYDEERKVLEHGPEAVELPVSEVPPGYDAVVQSAPEFRGSDLPTLLRERGFSEIEIERAPASWAIVGDVILVSFGECAHRAKVGEALLELHGGADTVLARNGVAGEFREPDVEVVAGSGDTETVHTEHGTEYALDLAEVMFSPGNQAERKRMGDVVSEGERVLDMFAGVGYFALPMARSGARVEAIEKNPTAFRYLLENAVLNGVQSELSATRGDCRDVETTAERVVMGYYDAPEYLGAALDALQAGGVLHMHTTVPEAVYPERPRERLREATRAAGRTLGTFDARIVKSHSEGVYHAVVDAAVE
jgi:tRNA wybutosine-synthesizing protein 2